MSEEEKSPGGVEVHVFSNAETVSVPVAILKNLSGLLEQAAGRACDRMYTAGKIQDEKAFAAHRAEFVDLLRAGDALDQVIGMSLARGAVKGMVEAMLKAASDEPNKEEPNVTH